MNLFEFFSKESDLPQGQIVLVAVVSGLANGMLLALINSGAESVLNQNIETRIFLLYLTAFLLYIYTQKYALSQASIALEAAVRKVRVRIVNKIRHTELPFIESIGGYNEIYTKLTQDSNMISQAIIFVVFAIQSVVVLVFTLLYIALLSPIAFLVCVIIIGSAVSWRITTNKLAIKALKTANKKETIFFNFLNHILEGFKEIKINQRKNDDVFQQAEQVADETEQFKVTANIKFIDILIAARVAFYILLPILVFILPLYSVIPTDVVFKITTATLFIIGPINLITMTEPMLARTNVALNSLYSLETELDNAVSLQEDSFITTPPDEFQTIKFSEVSFDYFDKNKEILFSIAPTNLDIKYGELLFIIGGNGSGKSTLLKLLTGLYYPTAGSIYVDDEEIDKTNYQSYRELFAIIFTDFHLFDKLYGLHNVDEKKLKKLLKLMELDKKTRYINGKFSHLDLSTGQKKRLAFISAVLEDKQIYVFDELAADQDPRFKKYFYEEVLLDLKQQGKTVIVVTHDDHYFHVADRVLKMEYGELAEQVH
ncbi:cyclic peptide export ABC transporter [Candidatus Halobeggiatoa sp. HSG11]|nr:cyclic peptide export ABC transporter [Candidatus Halobeggiatoa sp. HSG11]